MGNFKDKVVLITGAAGNPGRAAAEMFTAEGAHLALLMLSLNARSVFNTCQAVIPHMLSQGVGSIVNASARAAREGKAKMAPHCASKAAVTTRTESLAAEHKYAPR